MVSPLAQPVGGVRGQGGLPALPTQLCSFPLLSHKLGEEVMGLLQNLPSPAFSFIDAHSLCYNFTIDPHPSPGEPWCVVEGQVDGNVFLSYHCGGTKIQSTSPLGEEVKTTHTWETQTETLTDIGNFLKGQFPDIIPEKHTARGEFNSVQFSRSVVSHSLQPHGLKHASFPVLHQLPEVAQIHVHQVKLMSIESRAELGSPNTEEPASIVYG